MAIGIFTRQADFKEAMRILFTAHSEAISFEESFRSIGCDIQDTNFYSFLAKISEAMLLLHPVDGEEPDWWEDDLTRIKDFEEFWNKYYESE